MYRTHRESRKPGKKSARTSGNAERDDEREKHQADDTARAAEIPQRLVDRCAAHAATSLGHPPSVCTRPSWSTRRAATPRLASHGRAVRPRTIAAVVAVLASTHVLATAVTVRQTGAAGRRVAGSRMW